MYSCALARWWCRPGVAGWGQEHFGSFEGEEGWSRAWEMEDGWVLCSVSLDNPLNLTCCKLSSPQLIEEDGRPISASWQQDGVVALVQREMPVSVVPHAPSTHTHTHASTSNWAWALRMGKGNQGLRRPGNATLPSEIRDPSRTSRTTQNKGESPWAGVLGVRAGPARYRDVPVAAG